MKLTRILLTTSVTGAGVRAVTTAACLFLAGTAHAICIDVDNFKRMVAKAGQSIEYAATVEVRDTPTPAYIAIGRDGAWTAYFVYRDVLACVIASGRAWTEQGEIPPADLRPAPDRGPRHGG